MLALKAQWLVTAGIIPGKPVEEWTKAWHYTSEDYAADAALPPVPEGHKIDLNGPLDQPHMSRFTRMQLDAERYAASLVDPSMTNWVKTEWMWI